jgi:hypothetical protein
MTKKALKSPLTLSSVEKKDKQEAASRKRVRTSAEDAAEERRLTALLFGGDSYEQDLQLSKEEDNDEAKESHEIAENFFEIDRTGEATTAELREGLDDNGETRYDSDVEISDSERVATDKKPAWVDEDDAYVSMNLLETDRLKKLRKSRSERISLDGIELERRLRKRFQDTAMSTARTGWANVDSREKQEEEDNLLKSSTAPLLASSLDRLPPQVLSVVRCPDANQQDPNQAVVQAVHFHPGSDPDRPLMLTAGLDKTLRFFQVDAEESQKIHGIHCEYIPTRHTRWFFFPTRCASSFILSLFLILVDTPPW